jgi:hypothetical protein
LAASDETLTTSALPLGARRGQHRQRGPDGQEHRPQVHVEMAVEHLGRHLRQRHSAGPVGRGVDQRVHAPVGRLVLGDDPRDGLLVADVPRRGVDLDPVAAQLSGRGRELGLVAAGDRDGMALLAQHARERLADAARPAGDQGCPRRHDAAG